MKIRAIIFGATGMVGEGVLHDCLKSPQVESVLVVGRRACEVTHEKLAELFHKDFFDYSALEAKLKGYNACFFCLGVSSIGMKEEEYSRLTFDLTLAAASTLSRLNPDMTFCYVSGTGTDTSETGKMMWARVKGKTENNLLKLAFKAAYMFRPGFIRPIKGMKRTMRFSAVLSPVYPALKLLFPGSVCTLEDLGRAMIHAAEKGYPKKILENRDIADLAAG